MAHAHAYIHRSNIQRYLCDKKLRSIAWMHGWMHGWIAWMDCMDAWTAWMDGWIENQYFCVDFSCFNE